MNIEEDQLFKRIEGICWVLNWSSFNLHFALSYPVKPNDLFIVTYPRSGTTWMQNIVYNLQTAGQSFDVDIDHFFQQNPHLEIDGPKSIEKMQRPGAIKSHLPLHRIPYSSSAKYICVIRNPKYVCVSYYIFYNSWSDVPNLEFDRFFEYFLDGYLPFGNYFEALQSVWKQRHQENVLLISYEEMHTDLRPVIYKVSIEILTIKSITLYHFNYLFKIAAFISVTLDDQLLERVLKHASFEATFIRSIKNKEVAARRHEIFMAESELKTVRKGDINDWKSFMTSEQSDRIYQRFLTACEECDELENYWSKWNVF